jgi:hypothetical protein
MEISDSVFFDVYEPIKNHIDTNAATDGCLFETFGEELDFVTKVCRENPKRVWTLVDDDEGYLKVVAGMHLVNRLGYFITQKDWVTGNEFVDWEN